MFSADFFATLERGTQAWLDEAVQAIEDIFTQWRNDHPGQELAIYELVVQQLADFLSRKSTMSLPPDNAQFPPPSPGGLGRIRFGNLTLGM